MRILISDQNFGDDAGIERSLVEAVGGELVVAACRSEADVAEALAAHRPDAMLVQFAPVGERALAAANGLAAIVRYGVGLDNVDVRAAEGAGIAVAAVPDYCVDEVADHTIALLLAVERGIVGLAAETAAGAWDFRVAGPVRRLRGRTLALLGFGRIARAVAERAAGFGFRVVAFDPGVADANVQSLEELLQQADVLSVHVPLTDVTRGLVGARELDLLPSGAVVLNTSRGGILDEDALVDALGTGRLRGAGLDVLADEPPPPDHPLRALPNVVLTPHAAWFSQTAVVELRRKAVETALELARR
ncbi:MAG: C-terminal binding protein [Actinomycetota bacterium]|jgi:D-3-phosphoglycerate dehydrogenase / 2-oxoglutarate reductase|nr:C-terminal binding protein [Actinomycetota bacterium]